MSSALTELLTQLSTDEKLAQKFKKDKAKVMTKAGISDEQQKLVMNKEYEKIQEILGENFKISSNSIIKAFKV